MPLLRRAKPLLTAVAVLASVTFAWSAHATDRRDLLVGVKTLPMLDNAPRGALTIAIIFDPANSDSRADAEGIKAIIDAGLETADGAHIAGHLLPINDIQKLSDARLAFVTQGLTRYFDAIAQAATAAGSLTMSADLACVRANKCVLGIVSRPVVEIYYSRAASEATKVDFDPAFTMLVKKV